MTPYRLSLVCEDDPYPAYRALRDRDPAHYSPPERIWVLTRYHDVAGGLRDWRTWSSGRRGNLINDMPARIGRTLGTTDPPSHRFARGLVEQAFTRATVAGLVPRISRLSRELAAKAREVSCLEMVAEISAPLNAEILGSMFGVPHSDFLLLRRWLDDFFLRSSPTNGAEAPQERAMRKLNEYLDALAGERLKRPSEDLISAMLAVQSGQQRLTREQVVVTTMTFLTAGFESTNNLFTNLAHALAVHPGVYRQIKDEPGLVGAFIEEGMRWDAAAQGFVRCPTRDVRMHGTTIPEGAQVLMHIGSANRDGRKFPDPDRFLLRRRRNQHLGLGKGIHFCVGAPLARQMAGSLFSELVAASGRWEADLARARRVATPNFRGFRKLPLSI